MHTKLFAAALAMFCLSPLSSAFAETPYRLYYNLNAGVPTNNGGGQTEENWFAIDPSVGDWTYLGSPYDCGNWSPDANTIPKGKDFEQIRQCYIEQQRLSQKREQNSVTNEIRNVGKPTVEKDVGLISQSQAAIGALEDWITISALYTEWQTTEAFSSCTTWQPNPNTKTEAATFNQSAECKANQTRQKQNRLQEVNSGEIVNDGDPITENQYLVKPFTREYTVAYSSWSNTGDVFECTNWSPDEATIGKGIEFEQTATNCKINQTRIRDESYIDHLTAKKVEVGNKTETRTTSGQQSKRLAIGILEQWMETTPSYTEWVTTNPLYGCSNWSPSSSSVTTSKTFTQTATNCSNDQVRTRQDREKEQYTGEIRDKGTPVDETRTTILQQATRQFTVTVGEWVNTSDYSCSNWSPAPNTVNLGQTFTQTATNCSVNQGRSRLETYIDHNSGKVVTASNNPESQVLSNQTQTRSAIGTMENWIPATPTYTAWVDSSALDNCSNWSPAPATKTTAGTFTQTATDCTTTQTRTRQDREQEKNSGEYRNVGNPVTETQVLNSQIATRNYSIGLSAWANAGSIYACSNWSPDVNTVTIGQQFEQTATDCKQDQTRTRVESYVDHKTAKTVSAGSSTENQVLSAQTSKRNAIGTKETWVATTPTYTSWTNVAGKVTYGCSNWSPAGSSKTATITFTQTATDCETDQTRTRQDREQETTTLAYRNKGTPVTESQMLTGQSATRSYTVTLGAWTNSGSKYACTNWSPAPSTVTIGQSFTQTATDCKQDQTRTRSESYVDHLTGSTVAVSVPAESQTLTGQTSTQTATGTKETWVAATPTYTAWVNVAGKVTYGCSNWSPAGSTKSATGTFTQTATDCETDQTRTRQDREQETTTLAYRNKGTPVTESQMLTGQTATRSYTVTLGAWTNSGSKYACTNWSPAPSTVTIGQSFTQTATDCKQDQTRTRSESYVDHLTGSTVAVSVPAESQTLTGQTNTQTATGTKETWVAATPTYTAWANVAGKVTYGCSNWSPAGSSKTATITFTQTATDCKTDQTRTRQDREQETTTLAYRNSGTPVVENQTLTAQSATRSYTVTLGAWTNTSAIYGCANWSPDPSTVTINQTFTQTATDCEIDQARTRAESYVDHLSGATVAVSVPGETRTLTGQSSTRSATGTKQTWVATTPVYGAWTNVSGYVLYGCSNWSPAGSTKTTSTTFTQSATDCKTNQTRTRQDREQETTTLAYRNVGSPVTESQTLSSQSANRSYTVSVGAWSNTSGIYGCTNWSPAPSAQQKNIAYTQTATDCKINQTRTRSESYVDHISGGTVAVSVPNDTQVATTSSTQSAIGTKAVAMCGYSYDANGDVGLWRFWADGNSIWTGTMIPNVPSIWFMLDSMLIPFSNPATVQPGVSKVSATEYRYAYGSFTWRIYRGAYVGNTSSGFVMYQVCVE